MGYVFAVLLLVTAVFLILLVLIQRGRGGGLSGALGGMGGQSAFGTKAGDVFTRITIGVAAFWIILSAAAVKYYARNEESFTGVGGAATAPSESTETDPFSKAAPLGDTTAPAGGTTAPSSEAPTGSVTTPAPSSSETPAKTP
jgi:preprotein translocase subunit SecG